MAPSSFAQKSKRSAEGAEYESQGQVPSKARHVAPGAICTIRSGLKGRNITGITRFQRWTRLFSLPRGDALRFASRLPLAFIFRAFGAPFRLFVQR
jgi:hypothetical protein